MSPDDTKTTTQNRKHVQAANVTHPTGVRAKRAFPITDQSHLDPFVLFERFFIEPSQGFPEHPHGGFELITYMLEGSLDLTDTTPSLGLTKTLPAGDVLRTTAGRGVRHEEFPVGNEMCGGLQLWINLPQDLKKLPAGYQEASAEKLRVSETDGATVRTVVGPDSSIELQTPMEYFDATVSDEWTWEPPNDWQGFLFVLSGTGTADGEQVSPSDSVIYRGGDSVQITADTSSESDFRVVALAGKPHDEPIRQWGPFVE